MPTKPVPFSTDSNTIEDRVGQPNKIVDGPGLDSYLGDAMTYATGRGNGGVGSDRNHRASLSTATYRRPGYTPNLVVDRLSSGRETTNLDDILLATKRRRRRRR